ncbi:MAG: glycoside hydrolase family 2, partial [Alistipes sp.]|nr:glycoside hydrolase family 2 [Candidatus Minthomonas equi]
PKGVEGREAELRFEASSKQLFGKDIEDGSTISGEFMLGEGTFDSCKNPNAYAMTDTTLWKSSVMVSVNGTELGTFELTDDSADHSGALSWHSQPRENRMFEAGSHGCMIKVPIPEGLLRSGEKAIIRFTVPETAETATSGGLALYGRDFGKYPMDPSIVLK